MSEGDFSSSSNATSLVFKTGASEAAAEKVRITSGGKVGIGEASPSSDLTVTQSGSTFTTASQTVALFQRNSTANHGCKVSIIAGNNAASILQFGDADDEDVGVIQYEHDVNAMVFKTNANEAMRIHTGGNVSVGVNSITSGGFGADTTMVIQSAGSGGETLGIRSTSSSGTSLEMVVFRDGDDTQIGTIVGNASANTTSYGTSSDYRLKENVVDVDKPIEKLKKLKPKTFNMISDPDNKLDGFLAHELGEVIPNATHGVKDAVNEDGSIKPQQVDYGLITPLLTAALQEAVAKIETLEAKVTALEGG